MLYDVEEAVPDIKQRYSSVQVILLQCPLYSIKHWNNGRDFDGDFDLNDRQLEELIQIFNEIVDEKNGMSKPKLSMDLKENTKTMKENDLDITTIIIYILTEYTQVTIKQSCDY